MYTRSLQQLARKFQQASSSPSNKEKQPSELLFSSPTQLRQFPTTMPYEEEPDYDSNEDVNVNSSSSQQQQCPSASCLLNASQSSFDKTTTSRASASQQQLEKQMSSLSNVTTRQITDSNDDVPSPTTAAQKCIESVSESENHSESCQASCASTQPVDIKPHQHGFNCVPQQQHQLQTQAKLLPYRIVSDSAKTTSQTPNSINVVVDSETNREQPLSQLKNQPDCFSTFNQQVQIQTQTDQGSQQNRVQSHILNAQILTLNQQTIDADSRSESADATDSNISGKYSGTQNQNQQASHVDQGQSRDDNLPHLAATLKAETRKTQSPTQTYPSDQERDIEIRQIQQKGEFESLSVDEADLLLKLVKVYKSQNQSESQNAARQVPMPLIVNPRANLAPQTSFTVQEQSNNFQNQIKSSNNDQQQPLYQPLSLFTAFSCQPQSNQQAYGGNPQNYNFWQPDQYNQSHNSELSLRNNEVCGRSESNLAQGGGSVGSSGASAENGFYNHQSSASHGGSKNGFQSALFITPPKSLCHLADNNSKLNSTSNNLAQQNQTSLTNNTSDRVSHLNALAAIAKTEIDKKPVVEMQEQKSLNLYQQADIGYKNSDQDVFTDQSYAVHKFSFDGKIGSENTFSQPVQKGDSKDQKRGSEVEPEQTQNENNEQTLFIRQNVQPTKIAQSPLSDSTNDQQISSISVKECFSGSEGMKFQKEAQPTMLDEYGQFSAESSAVLNNSKKGDHFSKFGEVANSNSGVLNAKILDSAQIAATTITNTTVGSSTSLFKSSPLRHSSNNHYNCSGSLQRSFNQNAPTELAKHSVIGRAGVCSSSASKNETLSSGAKSDLGRRAPHQFLGKDLASLLESSCSPAKQITDFDVTLQQTNDFQESLLNSCAQKLNFYQPQADVVTIAQTSSAEDQTSSSNFQALQLQQITIQESDKQHHQRSHTTPVKSQSSQGSSSQPLLLQQPAPALMLGQVQTQQSQFKQDSLSSKANNTLQSCSLNQQKDEKIQKFEISSTSDSNSAAAPGAISQNSQTSTSTNSNQRLVESQQAAQNSNNQQQQFTFPDGGWVCSQCQNYNFSGRSKCNRCHKTKTKSDFNGKPKHLLRHQTKYDKYDPHPANSNGQTQFSGNNQQQQVLLFQPQQNIQNASNKQANQSQVTRGNAQFFKQVDQQSASSNGYQHLSFQPILPVQKAQNSALNQACAQSTQVSTTESQSSTGFQQVNNNAAGQGSTTNVPNSQNSILLSSQSQKENNLNGNMHSSVNGQSQGNNGASRQNEERVGDWVCMKCANLNFSFRMTCNRCFRDRNAGASVLKTQEELRNFQNASCPAQYIRSQQTGNLVQQNGQQSFSGLAAGLNSKAASFKPCAPIVSNQTDANVNFSNNLGTVMSDLLRQNLSNDATLQRFTQSIQALAENPNEIEGPFLRKQQQQRSEQQSYQQQTQASKSGMPQEGASFNNNNRKD